MSIDLKKIKLEQINILDFRELEDLAYESPKRQRRYNIYAQLFNPIMSGSMFTSDEYYRFINDILDHEWCGQIRTFDFSSRTELRFYKDKDSDSELKNIIDVIVYRRNRKFEVTYRKELYKFHSHAIMKFKNWENKSVGYNFSVPEWLKDTCVINAKEDYRFITGLWKFPSVPGVLR